MAALRFPDPSPCGKTPLTAEGLSKSYGSLEIFTDVDLAIDRGSKVVILGLNGAGKTTLLRMLAGVDQPDTGDVIAGHGLKVGYYAQEHETLDVDRTDLDPASRAEILGALRNYSGAVVLVSHDEGAVEALNPERVVLLPDGVEDHWNEDYLDLITLA